MKTSIKTLMLTVAILVGMWLGMWLFSASNGPIPPSPVVVPLPEPPPEPPPAPVPDPEPIPPPKPAPPEPEPAPFPKSIMDYEESRLLALASKKHFVVMVGDVDPPTWIWQDDIVGVRVTAKEWQRLNDPDGFQFCGYAVGRYEPSEGGWHRLKWFPPTMKAFDYFKALQPEPLPPMSSISPAAPTPTVGWLSGTRPRSAAVSSC